MHTNKNKMNKKKMEKKSRDKKMGRLRLGGAENRKISMGGQARGALFFAVFILQKEIDYWDFL